MSLTLNILNVLSFQKISFVVKTFENFSPCTLHNGCALLHNRIFLLNTHTMPASKQTHSYICLQDKRKSFTIENTSIGLLECMRLSAFWWLFVQGRFYLRNVFSKPDMLHLPLPAVALSSCIQNIYSFTKRKESNAFLVTPEF